MKNKNNVLSSAQKSASVVIFLIFGSLFLFKVLLIPEMLQHFSDCCKIELAEKQGESEKEKEESKEEEEKEKEKEKLLPYFASGRMADWSNWPLCRGNNNLFQNHPQETLTPPPEFL